MFFHRQIFHRVVSPAVSTVFNTDRSRHGAGISVAMSQPAAALHPEEIPFYGQFGEDRKLAEIFHGKRDGTCVDVGAHNGVDSSNSYHFEQVGWHCVLVEANPHNWPTLRSIRKRSQVFECAAAEESGTLTLCVPAEDAYSTVSTQRRDQNRLLTVGGPISAVAVPARSLDSILAEAGIANADFVSVDVEGYEMAVLRGFSIDRWKPRVLVVEDNGDPAVFRWMRDRGYEAFDYTGCNVWFARGDDAKLVNMRSAMRILGILALKRGVAHWRRATRPLKNAVKGLLGRPIVRI